jgi:uncharacterized protein (TIGR02099 family)
MLKLVKSHFDSSKTLRIIAYSVFGALIGLIFLSQVLVRFVLWPEVSSRKDQIAQLVGKQLGVEVKIGDIKTQWEFFRPSFEISQLTFEKPAFKDSPAEQVLSVPRVSGIIGWDSVWSGLPRFYYLQTENVSLTASRDIQGVWSYAGVSSPPSSNNNSAMEWVLRENNLSANHVGILVKDAFEGQSTSGFTVDHFSLKNDRNHHAIDLKISVTPSQGLVNVSGDFDHQAISDRTNWRNWTGDFTWDIQKVNLANFLKVIKFPVKTGSGEVNLKGHTSIEKGIFKQSDLSLDADQVDIDWLNTKSKLQLSKAHVVLDQTSEGKLQTIQAKNFQWQLLSDNKNVVHDLNDLKIQFEPNASNQGLGELTATSNLISIHEIALLVQSLPIPDKTLEAIQRLKPEGFIENLKLTWISPNKDHSIHLSPESPMQFRADGLLKEVGWLPFGEHIPGVRGLSANLNTTQEKGSLVLSSPNLNLVSEKMFTAKQVDLNGISGTVQWEKKANQWLVGSDDLKIQNDQIDLVASLKYLTPDKKDIDRLDLDLQVNHVNAPQLLNIIPKNLVPGTMKYLRETITNGQVENSSLKLHGDTHHIPYPKKDTGVFNLDVQIKDGVYRPIPNRPNVKGEWPSFEKVNAHVVMENNLLKVDATSAVYKGINVKDIKVNMDLAQHPSHLLIAGLAKGRASDFITYLTTSPLGVNYQEEAKQLSVSGEAQLDLKIDQEFGEKDYTALQAKISFDKNQIRLGSRPPGLISSGNILINEHGLKGADLAGNFLGGPITVKTNTSQADQIDIFGNIDADQLLSLGLVSQKINDQSLKNTVQGKVVLNGSLVNKPNSNLLNLNLDLRNTLINLPAPFEKKSNDPLTGNLRLEMNQVNNSSSTDWFIKIGDLIQSTGHIKNHVVERSSIALGDAPISTNSNGTNIDFNLDTIDADSWRKLMSDFTDANPNYGVNKSSAQSNSPPINILGKVKHLHVMDRLFEDINLQAHETNKNWDIAINSSGINGKLSWLEPTAAAPFGSVKANFADLKIPHPKTGAVTTSNKTKSNLRTLPSMDITVNDLIFGESKLGELVLLAHGSDGYWDIDSFSIKNKISSLLGKGRWELPNGNAQGKTSLTFDLETKNAGELITAMSVKENVLSNGSGTIHGDINWQGAPIDFSSISLNGDLQMELKNGTILQVDPGAAKLLGILSLQSLFKFATLNFKGSLGEVGEKGTPFDKISAAATIKRGIIRSNDFEMVSTIAKINARGLINLNRETQDLRVTIYPRINFGSASLAAFYFVTPIIGISAMIGQYLFSSGINQALQTDLLIQGSWQNPEVVPLDQSGQPLDPEVLKTIRRKALLKEPAKNTPPTKPATPLSSDVTP